MPGEAYILCPDVTRVKFAFYDHKKKEWETEWNTLDADRFPYLPTHVRITLTVIDARGQEVVVLDRRAHPDHREGQLQAGAVTTTTSWFRRIHPGARRSPAASAASRCWSC